MGSPRTDNDRKLDGLARSEFHILPLRVDRALWLRVVAWRARGGLLAPLIRKLLTEYFDLEGRRRP
jgi:hypothetical protein